MIKVVFFLFFLLILIGCYKREWEFNVQDLKNPSFKSVGSGGIIRPEKSLEAANALRILKESGIIEKEGDKELPPGRHWQTGLVENKTQETIVIENPLTSEKSLLVAGQSMILNLPPRRYTFRTYRLDNSICSTRDNHVDFVKGNASDGYDWRWTIDFCDN